MGKYLTRSRTCNTGSRSSPSWPSRCSRTAALLSSEPSTLDVTAQLLLGAVTCAPPAGRDVTQLGLFVQATFDAVRTTRIEFATGRDTCQTRRHTLNRGQVLALLIQAWHRFKQSESIWMGCRRINI